MFVQMSVGCRCFVPELVLRSHAAVRQIEGPDLLQHRVRLLQQVRAVHFIQTVVHRHIHRTHLLRQA